MELNRRYFLRVLAFMGLAPQSILRGIAEPGSISSFGKTELSRKPKAYHHLVYGGFLSGLAYYDYEKVHDKLEKSSRVELRREANNRYDRYAIEVYFGEIKLGYLPRYENKTLAHLLDNGFRFFTEVRFVDPDVEEIYKGVYVKVFGRDRDF